MTNISPIHQSKTDRLMVVLLIIFVSLILISSFANPGPIYRSDEVHYAAKAAHLAGQNNLLSSSWHAGYSLSLVPIFKLFGIQQATWIAVVLFNLSLLLGSIGFWFSTLQYFGISKTRALFLSISSLVCFSVWGFTAWMFVNPWMQLIIAMISRWLLIKHHYRKLFAITITSAFAYWVHPTGLLIAVCAWLIVIADLAANKEKPQLRSLLITILGIVVTGLLVLLYQELHSKINISMGGDGGHYGKQISKYLLAFRQDTLQTIAEVSASILNGIANMSIATYGYGIIFLTRLTVFKQISICQTRKNLLKVSAFILITTIALLLFSSLLAIDKVGNYQFMLHQRYFAPMIQALWILGLSQCVHHENRRNLPLRLSLALSPVLGAIIVGTVFVDYDNRFSIIDAMSSSSSLFSNALKSEHEALTGLAIGSLLIIAVQIMAWNPKLIIAGFISSIAGWTMNQTRANILSEGSGRQALIDEIKEISKTNRVCLAAIRTRLISSESNYLYELYLSSSDIQRVLHNRETYQDYNHFFNLDVHRCEYIIAPLDLHLTMNRNDLEPINTKLDRCKLKRMDDRYGWGLYQCSIRTEPIQQLSPEDFILTSTGNKIRALPLGLKPLRIFSNQALNRENKRIDYGELSNTRGSIKIMPCESIQSQSLKTKCNQHKEIIISKSSNSLLFWGLYINNLEPGNYQLVASELKVYGGNVTIEIVDENFLQTNKQSFEPLAINTPIPFQVSSGQKRIEIRIMATERARFSLPSYFIITN